MSVDCEVFVSLPVDVTMKDLETIIEYLRLKPLGASIKDVKSTLKATILSSGRINAYCGWGFVEQSGDTLLITEFGREFPNYSEAKKNDVFLSIVRQYPVYVKTLDYLFFQEITEITADDLASYWGTSHKQDVTSTNVKTLRREVMCFCRIADAAGLGKLIVVRGSATSSTRLEVFKDSLGNFLSRGEGTVEASDSTDAKTDTGAATSKVSALTERKTTELGSLPQGTPAFSPEININIQIHISADADETQISSIFASMKNHLFDSKGIDRS